MFKVEIPDSLIGKARYYYKGTEIDYLSIEEAKELYIETINSIIEKK